MGKNYNQILEEAREIENALVHITLVTNQDNGFVTYAKGPLIYYPDNFVSGRLERLSTTGSAPLEYLFFNNQKSENQPFSIISEDKLGVSISAGDSGPVAKFTLHSWGNVTFNVPLEERGNVLFGLGAPAGSETNNALYMISFNKVTHHPKFKPKL